MDSTPSRLRRVFRLGLLTGLAACSQVGMPPAGASAPPAPAGIQPAPSTGANTGEIAVLRQDRMRRVDERLAELARIAQDDASPDAMRARLLEHVRSVEDLARDLPGLFPRGSGGPPSRAQAEVWAQPEKFQAAAAEFRRRVAAFASVARDGDPERTRQAFRELDLAQACDACHASFRKDGPPASRATGAKAP